MVSQETRDLIERAEKYYATYLKEKLEKTHMHSLVAIEPDSGDYFFGETLSEASNACRQKHPDKRAHMMRVGHQAAVHIGVLLW
jgi:hypothetical protein